LNASGSSGWSNIRSVVVTVPPPHEWTSLSTGITEALNAVYFVDPQNGWVAGVNGAVFHTTNGGQSWQRQSSGTTDDLRDMLFLDLNRGWIVGGEGLILRTTDGGNTWETQTSPRDTYLRSIHFTDEDHGWIAGGHYTVSWPRFRAYGYVLRSTDGGDSWSLADYIYSRYALDLHFVNATHGWLVTEHIDNSTYDTIPSIYVTSDGGSTWTNQSIPLSTGTLGAVTFVDANTGWAVGGDGIILHTTNGGALWSQQGSGVTSDLETVQFVSPTTGWIVGSILHTTDGGQNWASQSADPACTDLRDLHFVDMDHGWAVGAHGVVCKYH
jgi:photosystem II stability/assembly factor-like uncharacterized protein